MIPLGVLAASVRRGGGGGGGDPYWSNVVALLHFNGADGDTTFADETGRPWTRNGTNTKISTAQSKFGGSSLLIGADVGPGTVNGIVTPSSQGFDFGLDDFTIEWWQYLTRTDNLQCHISRGSFGSAGSMLVQKDGGSVVHYLSSTNVFSQSLPTGGVWQHHVYCRQSGTVRKYRDGVQTNQGSAPINIAHTQPFAFGAYANGSYATAGYVDEVRITKGICRYPNGTTFTPPTEPYPDGP